MLGLVACAALVVRRPGHRRATPRHRVPPRSCLGQPAHLLLPLQSPTRFPAPPAPAPRARSFAQGAAAAQSGISVVQPNVGRLHDWYNRHPGVIRDPNVGLCTAAALHLQSCGRTASRAFLGAGGSCVRVALAPRHWCCPGMFCPAGPTALPASSPTPPFLPPCAPPQAPTEAWAMARAGYGGDQINPGLLLVEKIYNYVQVGWWGHMAATGSVVLAGGHCSFGAAVAARGAAPPCMLCAAACASRRLRRRRACHPSRCPPTLIALPPALPMCARSAEVPGRAHQGHGVGAAHQGRGAGAGRLRLPGRGALIAAYAAAWLTLGWATRGCFSQCALAVGMLSPLRARSLSPP